MVEFLRFVLFGLLLSYILLRLYGCGTVGVFVLVDLAVSFAFVVLCFRLKRCSAYGLFWFVVIRLFDC